MWGEGNPERGEASGERESECVCERERVRESVCVREREIVCGERECVCEKNSVCER